VAGLQAFAVLATTESDCSSAKRGGAKARVFLLCAILYSKISEDSFAETREKHGKSPENKKRRTFVSCLSAGDLGPFEYHKMAPPFSGEKKSHFILQMSSFYQDRLGTNIANKTLKRRDAVCVVLQRRRLRSRSGSCARTPLRAIRATMPSSASPDGVIIHSSVWCEKRNHSFLSAAFPMFVPSLSW
jgi:hypothetical protein